MKATIALAGLFLFFGQAFGQNFSVSNTDTTFYGEIDDSDFAAKFILDNDSTDTFPMTWEVYSESVQEGWDYSICDPVACHPVGQTTNVFNLPTTAANRMMNIHYFPNEIFGESTVVVKIWENAYPDDFVLLEWTGIVATAGIDRDLMNHSIRAFVQHNSLNVQYQLDPKTENAEFLLCDLTGKILDRKQVFGTDGTITLGENLKTGVYIYSLVVNGERVTSKKISL